MNPAIDAYLSDGCGRCHLYNTPNCKVHTWTQELIALRGIVLECGFTEELKWSMPCYTFKGKNVLILAAFKDFCSLNFFKGSLLKDEDNVLDKPGENSQASRFYKFTSIQEVEDQRDRIKAYLFEAIEIEKAGLKVAFKDNIQLECCDELNEVLEANPDIKEAFEALTPGRRRGYHLHFSGAKQSSTRMARINKYIPHILAGKGFHDR